MTSTDEPSEIFDAEAIANAVEFWRDGARMCEVPHEVLENVAASHEALRRELDELRSAARELFPVPFAAYYRWLSDGNAADAERMTGWTSAEGRFRAFLGVQGTTEDGT